MSNDFEGEAIRYEQKEYLLEPARTNLSAEYLFGRTVFFF